MNIFKEINGKKILNNFMVTIVECLIIVCIGVTYIEYLNFKKYNDSLTVSVDYKESKMFAVADIALVEKEERIWNEKLEKAQTMFTTEEVKIYEEPKKNGRTEDTKVYTISNEVKDKEEPGKEIKVVDVVKNETEGKEYAVLPDKSYVDMTCLNERNVYAESLQAEKLSLSRGDSFNSANISCNMNYVDANFNVYTPSGMTVEALQLVAQSKPGIAVLIPSAVQVEQEYGINVFFTLGVAAWESGNGTSALARDCSNYFGLGGPGQWREYNGRLEVGTYTFAQSIRSYGLSTISQINPIYCTSGLEWQDMVAVMMNEMISLYK